MKARSTAIRAGVVGVLLIGVLLAANLLIDSSIREGGDSASGGKPISLARPAFAQTSGSTFLEEEAGISAYTNVGRQIDLEEVKGAFRAIEYETEEYIIGSVPLPDYPESEDVHAFVHRDGWIVSYYLRDEPAAKIADSAHYTGGDLGSKLENGITMAADAAHVPVGDIRYYHFRYPDANRMIVAADVLEGEAEDTFRIKLPNDLTFYERSYSHYAHDSSYSPSYYRMYIDLEEISTMGVAEDETSTKYGVLSASQLWPDEFHTVKISIDRYVGSNDVTFGAIALIYQES